MGTYGVSQAYMDFWGLAQYDTPDYQYVTGGRLMCRYHNVPKL